MDEHIVSWSHHKRNN